ncbi:pentapeptide repeat-containing protein [Terrisporobacter sp.]
MNLDYQGQNLQGYSFVNMDLREANLENTKLDNIVYDKNTKYFEML